jgi:hypothetical protein
MPNAPRSVLPALPGGKYSDPAAQKWKRSRISSNVTVSPKRFYGTRKGTLLESVPIAWTVPLLPPAGTVVVIRAIAIVAYSRETPHA